MATRDTYLARFESQSDAIEFEDRVLQSGGEFLPAFAREVRDGGPDLAVFNRGEYEPSAEYWTWLCEQLDIVEGEG